MGVICRGEIVSYLKPLEKAIFYIENNLSENIKVEDVAREAGYSYYHFHRIFEMFLGETVGNYIRLRRLSKAAKELLYTDKRIIDITVQYQFESQESFSRAFKKVYKVTPSIYRKNRIETIVGNKTKWNVSQLEHFIEHINLKPKIVEIESKVLYGIRYNTSLKDDSLFYSWQNFSKKLDLLDENLLFKPKYGICEVNPDFELNKFSKETETVHFLGMEAERFMDKFEFETKELMEGKYAVFTHVGSIYTLKTTYAFISGTWLIKKDVEIDKREDFEYYDERFLGINNQNSEMDIYIPIR